MTHDANELDDTPGAVRDQTVLHRPSVWSRVHLWEFAELFVLSGFAIAQPLFQVTGKSPDVFLVRRAGRLDIILLVIGVMLLPALACWAVEVLVGLVSERLRRLAHLGAVTGLSIMLAIQVAKELIDLRGPWLVVIASLIGALAGALYLQWAGLRLWLRYLTPAPVVFALLFVLASPTSTLILPARATTSYNLNPTTTPGKQPPVVMILFDEFPLSSLLDAKGQIDKRVYPNFAELAGQSTWYRNATGVAGYTPWAMPAMLTGNYPAKVKAPSYTEYPDNMLTLFGKFYDLKVYETITQLCPPSRCPATAGNLNQLGLWALFEDSARAFKQIVEPYDLAIDPAAFIDQADRRQVSTREVEKRAAATQFGFNQLRLNQPSRFNDFLGGLKDTNRPTMHFLHLLLPHQPWRYLPSGNEYNFRTFGLTFREGQTPAPVVELNHQRHLLQLAYTDGLVGQVIDQLKAEGLWDKSLVVMGADHGQGWIPEEPSRTVGQRNLPDLMWVPMFIKAPNQDTGRTDDRNWEQVDLLPTVADLAGIQVPWKMEGASQTGKPTRTRTEKWWYDNPGRREVRDGPANWKVVLAGETDSLVRAREGPKGLYRYGPAADLIYQPSTTVGPISQDQHATAVLDDFQLYEQIKPSSGIVPVLVSGKLTSQLASGDATVLVAINGRIGGASRLFPERPGGPAGRFAVITPDTLWEDGDGRRQLQVYVVDRSGGAPRLTPVTLSSS